MTSRSTHRPAGTHAGSGTHHDAPATNPLVSYELTGEVRWLDVPLERIVLVVRSTNGHAGSFLGRDVTVDLSSARIHGGTLDELVPGTELHVKARLARSLHGELPDPFPALSAGRRDLGPRP